MNLEIINKLYLELSQIATAKTGRENCLEILLEKRDKDQSDQGQAIRAISLVADAREAALENEIRQLQLDNAKMQEALHSAIEATTDYNMIDKTNGKQYFKHEIFKREIEVLGETK